MDFMVLVVLALVLTIICFLWHQILLTMAAMIAWLAAGTMVLIGGPTVSPFVVGTAWGNLVGFVTLVMAFVLLVRFISRVGKTQVSHTDKTGKMWSLWEKPPKETYVKRAEQIREKRRQEIRSAIQRVQSRKK